MLHQGTVIDRSVLNVMKTSRSHHQPNILRVYSTLSAMGKDNKGRPQGPAWR